MRLLGKMVLLGLLFLSVCFTGCSDNKIIAPNKSNFKETSEKAGESNSMKVPPPPGKDKQPPPPKS